MKGRKPLPAAVRRLRNGRHDKRIEEPCPLPAAMPIAPWELTEAAKKEWDRLTADLFPLGVLAAVDGDALALYCDAVGSYLSCTRVIKKTGPIVKDRRGFLTANPALRVQREAIAVMTRFHTEFGLTPSARIRVTSVSRPREGNPFDTFLKGKPLSRGRRKAGSSEP